MTHNDKNLFFSKFQNRGAFLRRSEAEWWLWAGEDTAESEQAPVFYQEFFSSQLKSLGALGAPLKMSATEVVQFWRKILGDTPCRIKREHFRQTEYSVFEKNMQLIQGKIHRAEIEKAVPVVFAKNELRPTFADLTSWIENLAKAPMTLNVFGFWNESGGMIAASPEVLFHKKGNLIRSMALAGTCPRSEMAHRQPLLKDSKELHEHRLVVEDIQMQLGKWGQVQTSKTQVLELPSLQHLQTELWVETSPKEDIEIVRLLHPTPALGVSPRAYGFRWMEQLPEQSNRGLFGGPVLFRLSKEESLCLVAIRGLQWETLEATW